MTIMMMMMMIMTDPFTTNLVVKGPVVKGSVVKGAHPIIIVIITIIIIIIIIRTWPTSPGLQKAISWQSFGKREDLQKWVDKPRADTCLPFNRAPVRANNLGGIWEKIRHEICQAFYTSRLLTKKFLPESA